jgi:hypothetical protein
MKAINLEVVLHKLPSGKSPGSALEEQINPFLAQHPDLRLVIARIRSKQMQQFGQSAFVDFNNLDSVQYAASFGANGQRIESADELAPPRCAPR